MNVNELLYLQYGKTNHTKTETIESKSQKIINTQK